MEEIKVTKTAIIKFRIAEILHNVYKLVTACKYRMEVIK